MKKSLGLAFIGALVAANVVLLVALVRADVTPSAPTPTTVPAATATTTEPAADDEVAAPGVLHLAADGAVLQTWRGTCAAPGTTRLELSTDGGVSFEELSLPLVGSGESQTFALRTILDVAAESADDITVVGNDDQCGQQVWTTQDGGVTWAETDVYEQWFVPASDAEVVTPDGVSTPGCAVGGVDAISDVNAKVLCRDGQLLGTNDVGETWILLGALDGASDLAFTTISEGVALAPADDCTAAVYGSADGGETWELRGCADETAEAGSLLRRGADLLLSLEAGRIVVSDDDGRTWTDAQADTQADDAAPEDS